MRFVETYGEIKRSRPFSIRPLVRNLALDAFTFFDGFKDDAIFDKARIQFLYIHHSFADEENDLRKLIIFLQAHHRFISYSEAVDKILTNNIDDAYMVISADDGFKNNMRTAKILDEFGIKACFFICPSIVGEKDFNRIHNFCSKALHLPAVEFMNWDDVGSLMKSGHEIGSHTMSHINVAEVSSEVLTDELVSSRGVISKYCGDIFHFAYPYGKYYQLTEAIRKQVFDAGYRSCASAERGCHVMKQVVPTGNQVLIRRDHIILGWSIRHIKYFLRRNCYSDKLQGNEFPISA